MAAWMNELLYLIDGWMDQRVDGWMNRMTVNVEGQGGMKGSNESMDECQDGWMERDQSVGG